MKKLDPRELRKKVERAPSIDDLAYEEEPFDFKDFFKKSFRNKKLVFFTASLIYVVLSFVYLSTGTIYEKRVLANFNSSSNNLFFKYLDAVSGSQEGKAAAEDLVSFSNKSLTNLKTDDFIKFCFQAASNDKELAKIFDLDFSRKKSLDESSKVKIKGFFESKAVIGPFDRTLVDLKAKPGFLITFKSKDSLSLEKVPEKISKIIKEYLSMISENEMLSGKKLLEEKLNDIQKKLEGKTQKRFELSQSIPLVDKSSVYSLQSQLQATKITISGNKALEDQFQASLSDIEKKISTIGDVGNIENDPVALNLELKSLSSQKSQLQSQGLEKESFLYKNIASNLSKTLKELEESQKNLAVNQKKDESLFFEEKATNLNKFLDEINNLIANKLEKSLASDLEKSLSINFPEESNQRTVSTPQAAVFNQESIEGLMSQLESLKKVIEGNNFFESRLAQKIAGTEKRLSSFRSNPLQQKDVSGYIQDISNMAYLKNQLKLQGVDEDSVIAKRITENLKKATKELQEKKNISLKDLKIGDMYATNFDESSVYSQKVNLEKLKSDNNFYQAKIVELNKAIDELGFLLNDKAEKERQISELDILINNDRSSLGVLNEAISKMKLNEIKVSKRIEFSFEPMEEKSALNLKNFIILSFLISFLCGLCLSYFKELSFPSLKTIESFEDLGLEVLGGLPSTKNNLLQEGSVLDGVTNASYLRMGISIENIMSSSDGKVILLTSSDTSLKSATIALNLGAFFGNTGKKILILETDLVNNSIAKVTGAPLNGGISELYLHKEKINFYPFRVSEGLDVLTGDPLLVPPVYRLVSNNFKTFLEQLSVQYDYVFLHVRPCLDSPEASDLSRYADMGIVCCDTETINKPILDKLDKEMNGFLSKKTCLILENPKDLDVHVDVKPEIQKAAA